MKISTGIMALKAERVGWILRKSRMGGDWGLPRYVGLGERDKSKSALKTWTKPAPHPILVCILKKEIEGSFDQADSMSAAILTWNQGILIAELGLSPAPAHVQVWMERESIP